MASIPTTCEHRRLQLSLNGSKTVVDFDRRESTFHLHRRSIDKISGEFKRIRVTRVRRILFTSDEKNAFVVVQSFTKQQTDDHFRTNDETNLFLNASATQNTATLNDRRSIRRLNCFLLLTMYLLAKSTYSWKRIDEWIDEANVIDPTWRTPLNSSIFFALVTCNFVRRSFDCFHWGKFARSKTLRRKVRTPVGSTAILRTPTFNHIEQSTNLYRWHVENNEEGIGVFPPLLEFLPDTT